MKCERKNDDTERIDDIKKHMEQKVKDLDKRTNKSYAVLEHRITELENKLERLEYRLNKLEATTWKVK